MIRFRSILIAGVLALASMNVMANVKIIFASVPPDREYVMPPRGYATCRDMAEGRYQGVWRHRHRVCEYSRRGTWVSGYWQCARLALGKSVCMRWDWVPSHWEGARRVAVYHPPMPHPRPVAYPTPAVAYAPAPVQRQPVPVPAPSPVVVGGIS